MAPIAIGMNGFLPAHAGTSGSAPQTPESQGPLAWNCTSATIHLGIDGGAAYDPNRFGADPAAYSGQIQAVSAFVYVPKRPGRYPLVEMSHGLGDSRADWTVWGKVLASRGIIAVLLDRRTDIYPPASVAPPIACSSFEALSGPRQTTENDTDSVGVSYNVNSADILRVLRWALKQSGNPASLLYHKVDSGRLAITGHSFGGYLAILAANLSNTQRVDSDTGAKDWPKIKAVVLFDPTDIPVGTASSLTSASRISVPTAVLASGSQANSLDDHQIFTALPAGLNKLGLQVVGAAHNESENPDDDDTSPPVSSPNPLHQKLFMRYGMAWLEYWLQHACTVSPYLNGTSSASDQSRGLIDVFPGSTSEQGCDPLVNS